MAANRAGQLALHLSLNSAFADSSFATWFDARRHSGLLGKCSAQNQRICSGRCGFR